MRFKARPLEELIRQENLVASRRLEEAVDEARREGKGLGTLLVESGDLTETKLMTLIARQTGLDFVDLSDYQIDPSAASLIPEGVARRHKALPIGYEEEVLIVAMSEPSNVFALDDIRTITGRQVRPVVATTADILGAITKFQSLDDSMEALSGEDGDVEAEKLEIGGGVTPDEAPVVKLVNLIISRAVNERASDIHVEPEEKDLRIRFRIDGVLHEILKQPKSMQAAVISRLKIMADMDIAERRIPQDGRIGLVVDKKPIDVRVASLPTVYGEKLVLRILDKGSIMLELTQLGMSPHNLELFQTSFSKPYGMVLVTGPTGSGKSTTLYGALNVLNQPHRNIITVEDPVEYRLAGINQVQTHARAGLTFASALRSILRADPDVILVGEIRDSETARIAIEASLTGHLVLSTLHTNDAPSSIGRLIEMGVEPFLVASSTDSILAQRLARRLCDHCKEPYLPTREALVINKFPLEEGEEPPKLYRAVGCNHCSKTGYRGRVAITELMVMSEDLEMMAVERKSSDEIRRQAIAEGMVTLLEDGMLKVKDGLTSMEEIQRVVV
ncbi:MAG: GspE/PulE family protein [Actinomycetota bacterium]